MIVVYQNKTKHPDSVHIAWYVKPSAYKETIAYVGRLRIKRLRKNGRAERLRKAK